MHRVHHFWTSSEAYDASLDDEAVREGDVLVIIAERVVGLASTDPIAVTISMGALRAIPALSREQLLDELVHDEAAIDNAVDEAVRHGFPVARQFRGFGELPKMPAHEAHVAFSLDDIAVTADAIDHRMASLAKRAEAVLAQSSQGLVLSRGIDRLAIARERLAAYTRPRSSPPSEEQ